MTEAYNFLGSWQLFPEKGTYEHGARPKSGIYRLSFRESQKEIHIILSQVSLEDHAFSSEYTVIPDGDQHPVEDQELADTASARFEDSTHFDIRFYRKDVTILEVSHEITPQGYLKVTQRHIDGDTVRTNVEVYHRQLSVLPYAASVSGALIRPNEEGMIKHQALSAMEEQTNMQLTQIRQQIELLAIQAREIQKRKELSHIIYEATLGFNPVIGQTYHLYQRADGTHLISMVSPKEWGPKIPFKAFIATVMLLADHTWKEM
jgi:hypothetical protein